MSIARMEERHHQFYTTLLAGSESPICLSSSDLINQIKTLSLFCLVPPNSERQALFNIEEHEMIMKLVLAKNVEEATRLLDSHLLGSMKVIESAIEAA